MTEATTDEVEPAPTQSSLWWWVVGVILVVALAVRVGSVLVTRGYAPLTDAENFHRIATSILDGKGFGEALVPPATGPTAFRAPLFPVVLAGIYKVLGQSFFWARIVQAVLGTVSVGLIGLIANQVWGRRQAVLAMAVAAVYPPLILMTTSLQWEVLFVPLLLGALACALAYRQAPERRLLPVGAGVLVGLAALSRETGLLMVLPVAILVWQGARAVRRPLLMAAVVPAAAALVLAPWITRNAVRLDAFVPVSTSAGYALAGTYNATSADLPGSPGQWSVPVDDPHIRRLVLEQDHWTEPQLDAFMRRQSIEYLREHPTYLGTLAAWNTVRLFDLRGPRDAVFISQFFPYRTRLVRLTVYAWYLGALLAVVGAFTAKARRAPWALWLAPFIVFLSALFIVSGNIRYRQPIEPFVVLLAALGVDLVLRRTGLRIPFLQRLA